MIMDDGSNQGVLGDQGSCDDDVVCVCVWLCVRFLWSPMGTMGSDGGA